MKKIILLSIILISQFTFSQEETDEPSKKNVRFPDNCLSIYYIRYNNIGENFLSEAHKNAFGFGTQFDFLEVYGFIIGGAYEGSSFKITDKSLAGNIDRTNYGNIMWRFSYKFNLSEVSTIKPYIGIGDVKLRQRGRGQDFGKFKGTSYNIGVNYMYNIDKNVSFFTGLNFNYVSYRVNSTPEFQSFFDRSNQIQIHLGISFF